jgi:hypothetical protein
MGPKKAVAKKSAAEKSAETATAVKEVKESSMEGVTKKGRGRPRKAKPSAYVLKLSMTPAELKTMRENTRPRGRPRKEERS